MTDEISFGPGSTENFWTIRTDDSKLSLDMGRAPVMTIVRTGIAVDTITFHNSEGKPILIVHGDGKIELGAIANPDEMAKMFLDSLAKAFPMWLEAVKTGS